MFNEVLLFHNVILTFTLHSFITKTSARSWNKLDISRRKALLFCADIPHPDIGKFCLHPLLQTLATGKQFRNGWGSNYEGNESIPSTHDSQQAPGLYPFFVPW